MKAPLLAAEGLAFAYEAAAVLEGVSLEVHSGEVLGILGPNGAGKSTLLRVLLGLVRPQAGTVRMGGEDLSGLTRKQVARRAAFLPQGAATAFAFTVREVAAMGRHPHQGRFRPETPEDKAAVQAALDASGLAGLSERRVPELSGGERQRVFLARALAQATPLLVLDEPTANLDLLHAFQLLELVSRLAEEGRAVVAALHDLETAAVRCHRVLVLDQGRVAGTGAPEEVLTEALLADVFGVRTRVGRRPLRIEVIGPVG